jgi:hypothetical protein
MGRRPERERVAAAMRSSEFSDAFAIASAGDLSAARAVAALFERAEGLHLLRPPDRGQIAATLRSPWFAAKFARAAAGNLAAARGVVAIFEHAERVGLLRDRISPAEAARPALAALNPLTDLFAFADGSQRGDSGVRETEK